ncbi:MAG: hypothetical protein JW874_11630 [Spirochaetales bacterium]|nr:hypothetical protein [Spirochaetales bacterium]
MKSLGVCIGSSTVTYVMAQADNKKVTVVERKSIVHEGKPQDILDSLLSKSGLKDIDRLAVTGRKFRYFINAQTISEPEALELAYSHIRDRYECNVLVSAGSETVMVFQIDKNGKIIDIVTGNKCASGTGEFFFQQLKRMNVTPEDAVKSAGTADPYKVSGRCSVFCKSDCTHALNKGIPKDQVVSGLSKMMAGKITELLQKLELKNIRTKTGLAPLIVGGTAHNSAMIDFITQHYPGTRVPDYFDTFEALGTAIWALENPSAELDKSSDISYKKRSSFKSLDSLKNYTHMVTFSSARKETAEKGERCIIGLDVGSTTTKAVLVKAESKYEETGIIASVYLRTNGDPIKAARECYADIQRQINKPVRIIGLAVTGSGRQITGLHALTPCIINEIIAHAMAAAFYDREVDTIFEIGGQDAKYTYLTNGVASDYAMNEACSAGTGSFLEEAAAESLNIKTEQIGHYAMQSENPTNFSDQCAAFINSDIKSAIQEGIALEDITAGLVYSICLNYKNRVKGPRSIGNKVFMQGGVCYNRAVPVAMAALIGKEIVVPPDPGLMGAFGVALYVKNRLILGLEKPGQFDLNVLAAREVEYRKNFICAGGKEKCDRKCSVNRIVIDGKIYPFGGACNKYYNLLQDKKEVNSRELDFVQERERLVFQEFSEQRAMPLCPEKKQTIGIPRSLMTNTYYPLYYNFFRALGYRIICADEVSPVGIDKTGSSFCFPVEISHGVFESLLKENPDILFMPNVKSVYVQKSRNQKVACPFVQAESFYLKAAFPEIEGKLVLNPILDFGRGFQKAGPEFMRMARTLNQPKKLAGEAFRLACRAQEEMIETFKAIGRAQLSELAKHDDEIGIILFGRPYNAFSALGNKGIPYKFASRGYRIIPCDFIDFQDEADPEHVYWGMGETIVKGGKFISKHPNLFGVYITNFSCGPDSFVVNYFRKEQGRKPSLTLELDNHTADAGLDTRIEAFIDVVKTYREQQKYAGAEKEENFRLARIEHIRRTLYVRDSDNKLYKMTDPRVHLLFPSMNDLCSRAFAAVMRKAGIRASHVPDPSEYELKLGLGYTSGKECLPAIITTGSLMRYLEERKDNDEILVYFMPGDSGPCRFGSYYVMMQNIMEKMKIRNVAFLNLSQEDGYIGFSAMTTLQLWLTVLVSDIMENIYAGILVLAEEKDKALAVYHTLEDDIADAMEKHSWPAIRKILNEGANKLSLFARKAKIEDAPKVAIINEMYVRRNNFSRQWIVEKMAERGIIGIVAALHEWVYYLDKMVLKRLVQNATLPNMIQKVIERFPKRFFEKRIKAILARSGFYQLKMVDIEHILDSAQHLVTPTLICESIIVTGTTIAESIENVDGVMSIQPFGCMPGRIAEAIINRKLGEEKLSQARDKQLVHAVMQQYPHLPFMTLEMDGQVMSQGIEAKLETFCLQVERINKKKNLVRAELVGGRER